MKEIVSNRSGRPHSSPAEGAHILSPLLAVCPHEIYLQLMAWVYLALIVAVRARRVRR